MNNKFTTIYLPKISDQLRIQNYRSRAEMIEVYRKHATWQKEQAEALLAAPDEDFIVEQHTGVYVRRNINCI